MNTLIRLGGGAIAAAIAAFSWDAVHEAPGRRAACARVGASHLEAGGVQVLGDSDVTRDTVRAGRPLACDDDPNATAVFEHVRSILARSPAPFTPDAPLVVHYAPNGRLPIPGGVALHRATGALLVARDALPETSVLAHEIVHARIARASRTAGALATRSRPRVLDALEEATADYAAATLLGRPVIGDPAGVVRDLTAPPSLGSATWPSVLAATTFDPHPLGWEIAAALWTEAPSGELVDDLIACFAPRAGVETDGPAGLERWLNGCPMPSRAPLGRALAPWRLPTP